MTRPLRETYTTNISNPEKEMEKLSTKKLCLQVILVNLLVPLFFVQASQTFLQIFNPSLDLSFIQRVTESFKPIMYLMFLGAELIVDIFLIKRLWPLFSYLKHGKNYKKARTSALSIPWILIITHTGLWIVSNTAFYLMYNWKTPGGVPYLWSVSILSLAGAMGALYTALIINNLLVPYKIALNMTGIEKGERDIFVRIKLPLVYFLLLAGLIVYSAFGIRYYLRMPSSGALLPPEAAISLVGLIIGLLLGGALFSARREDSSQFNLLRNKLNDMIIGKGNLQKRVTLINFDPPGELASQINRFIEKLSYLVQEIDESGEEAYKSSLALESVLSETVTQIQNMSVSIENINKSSVQQRSTVETVDSSLVQMLSALEGISHHTETQASFVEETSGAMNEMASSISSVSGAASRAGDMVDSLGTSTETGRKTLLETEEAIRGIEASSLQVGQTITEISKIAALTNLLAMNASIEAAHAGASGKGFAVVADEVRKLAEESAKSTKKISVFIKEMGDRVKQGVEKSRDTRETLSGLFDSLGEISRLVKEIDFAMDEQDKGTRDVLDSVSSIVNSTQEIRDLTQAEINAGKALTLNMGELVESFSLVETAAKDQARGNSSIQRAAERLKTVSEQNRKVAETLKSLLSQFSEAEETG